MTTQARQLVTVLDNCHKAGFNSNQPRIPAGQPSGGQWTEVTSENYQAISKWERWGDAETLQRHYDDHRKDFRAKSARDYARQARQFFQHARREKLPTIVDRSGITRIYDPATNTFGSYNPDGSTRTFFKPKEKTDYFRKQIKRYGQSGRVINPLPKPSGRPGRGGGGGGGGFIDPFRPKLPRIRN